MRSSLSAPEARRVALHAQGFGGQLCPVVGTRQLTRTMARLHALQIDSVNVFARAHYMPLFSRLGIYDTSTLDELLFSRRPRYVEFTAHEAAFIPAADWGLFRFRMDDNRAKHGVDPDRWFQRHQPIVEWVRSELTARGPLRPAEIEHDAQAAARGPWWDWDVVKQALELLWLFGEIAIAGRRGFERRYGLAEHVIAPEVLSAPVARADAMRELVHRAARAYGVATASDLADYWRIKDRRAVMDAVRDLVSAGELMPVSVDGWTSAGRQIPAWMHRNATLPKSVVTTAILSPFDPVVWFRPRAARLFDFHYRIEIYTPRDRRRFGYYSLPVLMDDTIVGRVDLKADRSASTLRVQSAWWEPDRPDDAALRLAHELRRAARWQGVEHLSVSGWGNAAEELAAVLPDAGRHAAGHRGCV